jgi:hypothetical protein
MWYRPPLKCLGEDIMNYVFYKGYTVYEDGTIIDVFGNPAQVIFEKRDGYYSVKITEAFGTKI